MKNFWGSFLVAVVIGTIAMVANRCSLPVAPPISSGGTLVLARPGTMDPVAVPIPSNATVALRELQLGAKTEFSVLDASTRSPIAGARVLLGQGVGRHLNGESLGLTDDHGLLSLDGVYSKIDTFAAFHADGYFPFHEDAASTGVDRKLVALVNQRFLVEWDVVDGFGRPISGAQCVVSRMPLEGGAAAIAAELGPAKEMIPAFLSGRRAEYVAVTSEDGRCRISVPDDSEYFWDVSCLGYIPWGNELPLVVCAPGNYKVILQKFVAAAVIVVGDEVVTHANSVIGAVHQPSIPLMMAIQEQIVKKHRAVLASVVPVSEWAPGKDMEVTLFLRRNGWKTMRLPFMPFDDGFAPHVYQSAVPDRPDPQSGRVRCIVKNEKGAEVPGVRWSLSSAGMRWHFESVDSEIELPPGDYELKLESQVLRSSMGSRFVRVHAGQVAPVGFVIPANLFRGQAELMCEGRLIADMRWHVAALFSGDKAVDSYSAQGASMGDLWLQPGRYRIQAYSGGYAIDSVEFDVPAAGVSAAEPWRVVLDCKYL